MKIPATFTGAHDAIGIYLSWNEPQVAKVHAPEEMKPGNTYDVPVVFTNGTDQPDTQVRMSLAVVAKDPADAATITVTCSAGRQATCPTVHRLLPGKSTTATFRVGIPASAPAVAYRLVATTTLVNRGHVSVTDSADVISPCGLGDACEAENGQMAAGACPAADHPGYTGTGFVACFTGPGPTVTQQFKVPGAGEYNLDLRYAAGPGGPNSTRTATVTADGARTQVQLPLTGSWDTWGDSTVKLQLNAGVNDITVAYSQPISAGSTLIIWS